MSELNNKLLIYMTYQTLEEDKSKNFHKENKMTIPIIRN